MDPLLDRDHVLRMLSRNGHHHDRGLLLRRLRRAPIIEKYATGTVYPRLLLARITIQLRSRKMENRYLLHTLNAQRQQRHF